MGRDRIRTALGDGGMLKGFRKEIDITLHFRKITPGTAVGMGVVDSRQETGFKEQRLVMSSWKKREAIITFKLLIVNLLPNALSTNFNISKSSTVLNSSQPHAELCTSQIV